MKELLEALQAYRLVQEIAENEGEMVMVKQIERARKVILEQLDFILTALEMGGIRNGKVFC